MSHCQAESPDTQKSRRSGARETIASALRSPLAHAFAALACVYGYGCYLIHQSFVSGFHAFEDLGLICDFLSNTAHGRGLFLIGDTGASHLSIHFTPSLVLLLPLFVLVDSQAVLLYAGWTTFVLAVALCLGALDSGIDRAKLHPSARARSLALVAFALLLSANRYAWSLALSGHFEIFAVLPALIALVGFVEKRSPWTSLAALVVALGVRQDAAFFLFFACAGLFLLPARLFRGGKGPDRRALVTALALCVIWLVLSMNVVLPLFGASPSTHAVRFWKKYGAGWGEILDSMFAHPTWVARDIMAGGFTRLNEPFLWLDALHPLAFLSTQVPGVLLYTASDNDKRMLFSYNSAFLLPGVLLLVLVGWLRLARAAFYARALFERPRAVLLARAVALALPACLALAAIVRKPPRAIGNSTALAQDVQAVIVELQHRCPGDAVYAADFRAFVFLPNSRRKVLTRSWSKADVTLVTRPLAGRLAGAPTAEELERVLRTAGWTRSARSGAVTAFARPFGPCH